MTGRILFIAFIFWTAIVDLHAAGEWTVLKNCHLIQNPANDGDSFHVSVGATEYLFRLYLVDASEIEEIKPDRLIEQAKYFGITVPEAIEAGEAAKMFTQEALSKPFTVFTHLSGALGNSKLARIYVFVQAKEGDLGEQLVRNGLARVHGTRGAPPGMKTSKEEVEKLQQLEDQARAEKIGSWGIKEGRLNVRADSSASYSFFDVQNAPRPVAATLKTIATPGITATPNAPPSIAAQSGETNSSPASTSLGRLDINTATVKELEALPGIGPVMAARIIAARPFQSADDLRKVNGIGDKVYAKIRPYFQ